jgi:hypothetical protein
MDNNQSKRDLKKEDFKLITGVLYVRICIICIDEYMKECMCISIYLKRKKGKVNNVIVEITCLLVNFFKSVEIIQYDVSHVEI